MISMSKVKFIIRIKNSNVTFDNTKSKDRGVPHNEHCFSPRYVRQLKLPVRSGGTVIGEFHAQGITAIASMIFFIL